MEVGGPSLPSNYVTILHLKERWLQQQQQQSSSKSDSQHDSGSKTPNESLPILKSHANTKNHNQLKSHATVHDSDSKIPNEPLRHRMITNDSASKTSNHTVHRNVNKLNPTDVVTDDSDSKTGDNQHTIVEKKQEHNTDQSSSKPKPSATKDGSRGRNPRFVTEQIPADGGNTPEPVLEK